jgi:hypothetical protein
MEPETELLVVSVDQMAQILADIVIQFREQSLQQIPQKKSEISAI